jgi:hypothetical protein
MTRPRAFDDNGAGVISYRGWLYSGNEAGDPLSASESVTYEKSALSDARLAVGPLLCDAPREYADVEERPNPAEELARLTTEERTAWELQRGCHDRRLLRITAVPVGELVAMARRGYTVVEKTKREMAIGGCFVEVWDVEGIEYVEQGMSRSQIAVRMGASDRQVKRWLFEARRKLRGER